MNQDRPDMSGLEIRAVLKELDIGKVDQIYLTEDEEFLFQYHAAGKGKKLLRLKPGKYMFLTQHKPLMAQPTGFCMQLRKYLSGAQIDSFEQVGSQRVVHVVLRGGNTVYHLYIEFFSRGNVILCDEKLIVLGFLNRPRKDEYNVGMSYVLPVQDVNIFEANSDVIMEKSAQTSKLKLVTFLASDLSLGGLYAEEVCARAELSKTMNPHSLDMERLEVLTEAIVGLFGDIDVPKGYTFEKGVAAPTPLLLHKGVCVFETFNEALDELLGTSKPDQIRRKKEEQYQAKINRIEHIRLQQEKTLVTLQKKAEEHQARGDWLYGNYGAVKALLDQVKGIQQKHGWSAVKKFLEGLKKVEHVDLKEKVVDVTMDET